MGLLQNVLEKWKNRKAQQIQSEIDEQQEDKWDELVCQRDYVNLHNEQERKQYVLSCLTQMTDASTEIDNLTYEYSVVTSYLTDIEEIESLPEHMHQELMETAMHLTQLDNQKQQYQRKPSRMSDTQFQSMQRLEEETEEGIRKLSEAEDYQKLVKADLKRLHGERHSFYYRKKELETDIYNYRGMSLIVFVTLILCLILLLILQFALQFDTKMGYILVVCAATLSMTLFFVKNNEAQAELSRVERSINKLILLQNTVKIRFVNNQNLMDYLRMKYRVESAEELGGLWEQYQEEKTEREKYEQAVQELGFYQKDLLRILRTSHVKDPSVWLHQAAAIVDPREMVEIRHQLVNRRQKLRSQMDYNKKLAEDAQKELKDLCQDYPQYAQEILEKIKNFPAENQPVKQNK